MNWGAHKADVRIAAKNSVTMRAALRASINARNIYEAYQDTHPFVTDNITQDRTRARAWAMLHVKIDPEPIQAALKKIYTDGFLLGLDASKEAIGQAVRANEKAKSKAIKDELLSMAAGDGSDYVDWNNWKPGNRAAALQYRPTGAFKTILDNAGIVSKTIAKAGYDRIGTALADSIAAGFSPERAAKVIAEKIGDPARALTIAITEQNRAMSLASMQNYKDYGLEKVEWSGANPCDLCAPNEGQVVALGEQFESGDTEPPVHPNCRCALLPVIDEAFYAEPSATDGLDLLPQDSADVPREQGLTGVAQFDELFGGGAFRTFAGTKEIKQFEQFQMKNAAWKKWINREGKTSNTTNDEKAALRYYKMSGYELTNIKLRGGRIPQENETEVEKAIKGIDTAMKKAPKLSENIITYRGERGKEVEALFSSLNKGDQFDQKGYSSTSLSGTFAEQWHGKGEGRWLLTIENPKGTTGIMLDAIQERSEKEWLLPRGTKFEVKLIDKTSREVTLRVIK